MTDDFCSGWFALVLVLARQHLMLVHIRVAAMQTGQELMDILFSSYRIADGYFCSDWFERRGQVTGGVSGAWLVLVWGVVLMLYVWVFQSMLLSMMMKPNMEKPIDITKEQGSYIR